MTIMRNWPIISLNRILRHRKQFVQIDDLKTYKRCRVQLHAQGIVPRDEILGAEIKTKQQQVCRAGEFLVAEIDAKVGGYGIVPEDLNGAIVSSHYFLFEIDEAAADRRYLGYFIKTPAFHEQVEAQGTTNYAAIRPQHVLSYSIPLPPLSEQRRIVARLDALAAKIKEARSLRSKVAAEVTALLASVRDRCFKPKAGWKDVAVGDICEAPQYGYTAPATTSPVGPKLLRITDIQNGAVNWDSVPNCECPDPAPYYLKAGDILFARTGGTTGKSFLIKEAPEAVFASYLIRLRVKPEVSSEYLYEYFQSPSYWTQVLDERTGTGQPNVNGTKLANLRVPLAPPVEQKAIVDFLWSFSAKIQGLAILQGGASAEMAMLLPRILDKAFTGGL